MLSRDVMSMKKVLKSQGLVLRQNIFATLCEDAFVEVKSENDANVKAHILVNG